MLTCLTVMYSFLLYANTHIHHMFVRHCHFTPMTKMLLVILYSILFSPPHGTDKIPFWATLSHCPFSGKYMSPQNNRTTHPIELLGVCVCVRVKVRLEVHVRGQLSLQEDSVARFEGGRKKQNNGCSSFFKILISFHEELN